MLEHLVHWDQYITFGINALGSPYLDTLMILLSDRYIWIPLYLFLLFKLYERYGTKMWLPLVLLVIALVAADQITSGFMKPYFERLRPCRDPRFADQVVVIKRCGSKYGFASSHAANTMALGISYLLYFGRRHWLGLTLTGWALLVGYSRIYLGVHYFFDVLAGFTVGALVALLLHRLYTRLRQR